MKVRVQLDRAVERYKETIEAMKREVEEIKKEKSPPQGDLKGSGEGSQGSG
jgi:hypothetical protein